MQKRTITEQIQEGLNQKMVFLTGPRQVGKTTLAKEIIASVQGKYLLYDDKDDRKIILNQGFVRDKLVCLDEFHKFARWKNQLKGVYDKYQETLKILVTGSARLDIYQKAGDSLFGRYFLYHLFPLTLGEVNNRPMKFPEKIYALTEKLSGLEELLKFSGFPEPFFKQNIQRYNQWANLRRSLLLQEDFRELSHIQLLSLVEQLMILLPERIGSAFSYRSLSEDIQVSVPTIQNWLSVFEKLFLVFKITPYAKSISRGIKRQPKYYLWDWAELTQDGPLFENLVAVHLFKAVTFWNDQGLSKNATLQYIKDADNREVDFLVAINNKPWFLVEAKCADEKLSESLLTFSRRLNIPGIQLTKKTGVYREEQGCLIVSADRWLGNFC